MGFAGWHCCRRRRFRAGSSRNEADRCRTVDAHRVRVQVGAVFGLRRQSHHQGADRRGSISDDSPLKVDLTVRSADLRVLDPDLSANKRAEVQARMISAEVLDVMKFPEIAFTSTSVEPAGADRWTITGRLTIHGQTRTITFAVSRANGRYRGDVLIKQRDFGIEPIRIAAGAVKVKDELKVEFDIKD